MQKKTCWGCWAAHKCAPGLIEGSIAVAAACAHNGCKRLAVPRSAAMPV